MEYGNTNMCCGDTLIMQGYKHLLIGNEIDSGRIYISQKSEDEFMRVFGQIRNRPFNIFGSDNRVLLRSVAIQKSSHAGLRINFGKDTFADCVVGTPIWLYLRPDSDMEIQIGSATDLTPNPNAEKFLDVTDVSDDFYKNLIDEINHLYRHGFMLSLSVLIRKLLENLLIDILRKRYGASDLSLYFDTSKHRFLDFSILIENFKSRKTDFQHVTPSLDNKLVGEINSYKEMGNSGAHSIDANIKIEFFKDKRAELNYLVKFLFRLLKNTPS
jgi:hypothetical protein